MIADTFPLSPWLVILRRLPFPKKLGLLERIFGRKLEKAGSVWIKTFAGPTWKLDLRNPTHRWIVYGYYEGPGFIPWARRWLRHDSVVVDSGANIGQVLLYLAPILRSGSWVAVEPHPVARKWLEECLLRQGTWNVRVEAFGLGEKEGRGCLSEDWGGDSVGSHTYLKDGSGDIPILSLDQFAEKNSITKIRLWKLDMEGGEAAALRGAENLFHRKAIEALVIETDGERFPETLDAMRKLGFSCYSWHGKPIVRVPEKFFGNVLFILT